MSEFQPGRRSLSPVAKVTMYHDGTLMRKQMTATVMTMQTSNNTINGINE